MDGTLAISGKKDGDSVWYGKSVIRSCARLDYTTAQNIIEGNVAMGEKEPVETLWPKARQPTGGHTIAEVARDVRLLHQVAKARRTLRYENGALELHGVKLAFSFPKDDHTTPGLCEPYPIKDSNRLIEEYMLLANYLVAQRLITHAGGRALLRQHPPPVEEGLGEVIEVAKSLGYELDSSSSQTLQASLTRIGRGCDDLITLQGITSMMMVPMKPAEYIAAGEVEEEEWRHFALNIPYYTHFTSPIRRYADVIVHRLLQATLDGEHAVENFPMSPRDIHATAKHCNEKRMASKMAQERSDIVFLSLYLKRDPISKVLGIVTSLGEKTFTVFIPSLGLRQLVFLQDHDHFLEWSMNREGKGLTLKRKQNREPSTQNGSAEEGAEWPSSVPETVLSLFSRLYVSCRCSMKPPINVKVHIVAPYQGEL